MVPPRPPRNEPARLFVLHQLGILDTPPEDPFDRVTRLARRLFDAPIALVSFVDAERQWFKSRDGLDVAETPRTVSFCGHAVEGDAPLVVPDAQQDFRFADNPLVVGFPNIRFYAGYPIRGPEGSALGTLCVLDHEPRSFSEEDVRSLSDLAAMVSHQLAETALPVTDEGTGLPNRRGLANIATPFLASSRVRGAPVSLISLRLDGVATTPDARGPAAGDGVLNGVARVLRRCARETDVPARLSGAEFAVLLADTPAVAVSPFIAGLSSALARIPQLSPGTGAFTYGSATAPTDAAYDLDELLAAAEP